MKRMRSTGRTKLFDGEFVGLFLLVFGGSVVAPFTSVARHPDEISHDNVLNLR